MASSMAAANVASCVSAAASSAGGLAASEGALLSSALCLFFRRNSPRSDIKLSWVATKKQKRKRTPRPAMRSSDRLLLLLCCCAAAQGVSFDRPIKLGKVGWGVTDIVSLDYSHLAVTVSAGVLVSNNAGANFTLEKQEPIRSSLTGMANSTTKHGFGRGVTAKQPNGTTYHLFRSNTSAEFSVVAGQLVSRATAVPVNFSLPVALGSKCYKFACPFRLQGTAAVAFDDGTQLQTGIVSYGGNPAFPDATSIVAFHSQDGGYSWQYISTLARARDYVFSQEGPNEHDLALLGDRRTVLAVVRMDAGDGAHHQFLNYYKSFSTDQGRTWSKLEEMKDIGCARPRLLFLNGVLFLSGGRQENLGIEAPMLWIDKTGTSNSFETYSVPYYHNLGETDSKYQFTSAVNHTKVRESSCYTALAPTSATSAMVMYDVIRLGLNTGFAMNVHV
eukprot:m.278317 g.278317  ORF g.278317 m.278317 type:complete len:446 (+) comp22878_c1_seq13:3217-4554(+)